MGVKVSKLDKHTKINYQDLNLIRLIGQGTDDRVFEAQHKRTKKRYALKVIEIKSTHEHRKAERLRDILLKLKSLNHPNLLPIYSSELLEKEDHYGHFEQYFIVLMELSTLSLEALISQRARSNLFWSEHELLKLLYEFADALHSAEELGISHKDIKDRNILLCNGQYVLTDFGDSKLSAGNKNTGIESLLASLNFMSPELFKAFQEKISDFEYDEYKSDVYSMGLVFIKMAKLSLSQNRIENLEKEIEFLKSGYEILPDILHKMLTKSPAKRISWKELKALILKKFPGVKSYSMHDDRVTNEKILENIPPPVIDGEDYLAIEHLAKGYLGIGLYEEALQTFAKAIEVFSLYHKGDDKILKYRLSIAYCYRCLGLPKKALEYDAKALDILQKSHKSDDPKTAIVYSNIATDYSMFQDYEKSIEFHLKALEIRKKTYGEESMLVAETCINLADDYSKQQKLKESLGYYNKALDIVNKSLKDKKHQSVALLEEKLGETYFQLGEVKKCIEHKEVALEVRKKVFGEEHPLVIQSTHGIAKAYSLNGQHSLALQYFTSACNAAKKIMKADDPKLIVLIDDLAREYYNLGSYKQALDSARISLKSRESQNPKDYEGIAQNLSFLGTINVAMGQLDTGINYKKKALALQEKIYGPRDAILAQLLIEIGNEFTQIGDQKQAIQYKKKAIELREKAYGVKSKVTADAYLSLADSYLSFQSYSEAMDYAQKNLRAKILLGDSLEVAKALHFIAKIHAKKQEWPKAKERYEEALEKMNTSTPSNFLADLLLDYGESLQNTENFKNAIRLKKQALDIRIKMMGDTNIEVGKSYESLADSYYKQQDYGNAIEYYEKAKFVFNKCFENPENPNTKRVQTAIDNSQSHLT